MTTDRETLVLIGEWLEEGRTQLPDHVLETVLERIPSSPQRRPSWRARRDADADAFPRYAIAAAAVVLVAIAGLTFGGILRWSPTATAPPSASPAPAPSDSATPRPSSNESPRPTLRLGGRPGTTFSPAGDYGYVGGPGASPWWAHRVIEDEQPTREATVLAFTVGPGCLDTSDPVAMPVTIAGFQGVMIEPYEHDFAGEPVGEDDVWRGYALAVGDRTLCAFIGWHRTTTDEEIRSAAHVLDTLRAEPAGRVQLRISFFLPEGWDTG
jgi:hypothetical protein